MQAREVVSQILLLDPTNLTIGNTPSSSWMTNNSNTFGDFTTDNAPNPPTTLRAWMAFVSPAIDRSPLVSNFTGVPLAGTSPLITISFSSYLIIGFSSAFMASCMMRATCRKKPARLASSITLNSWESRVRTWGWSAG